MKTDVVIVGAGVSGLTTAYYLKKKGLQVHVLEKDSRTGGAIQTKKVHGFLVEQGANSTLDTSPLFHELFTELSIEKDSRQSSVYLENLLLLHQRKKKPLLNLLDVG